MNHIVRRTLRFYKLLFIKLSFKYIYKSLRNVLDRFEH